MRRMAPSPIAGASPSPLPCGCRPTSRPRKTRSRISIAARPSISSSAPAVGGGYDAYARLVARHFGRHIPGNPAIVVQNMPGAGSNKAAAYLALQAPKDGTAIGAIQPGAILQPLLSDQPVPHDPSKFILLGSANSSVYLCMVRTDAPVKTFQDTFTQEVIIGASAEGATLRDMPACSQCAGREIAPRRRLCRQPRDHARDRAQRGAGHVRHGLVEPLTQHRDWISSGLPA